MEMRRPSIPRGVLDPFPTDALAQVIEAFSVRPRPVDAVLSFLAAAILKSA